MGTAVKHPVPDRVMQSLVIFDIRALWRLALGIRVPGCQILQVWHRMLRSTHMATVGIRGLRRACVHAKIRCRGFPLYWTLTLRPVAVVTGADGSEASVGVQCSWPDAEERFAGVERRAARNGAGDDATGVHVHRSKPHGAGAWNQSRPHEAGRHGAGLEDERSGADESCRGTVTGTWRQGGWSVLNGTAMWVVCGLRHSSGFLANHTYWPSHLRYSVVSVRSSVVCNIFVVAKWCVLPEKLSEEASEK